MSIAAAMAADENVVAAPGDFRARQEQAGSRRKPRGHGRNDHVWRARNDNEVVEE
jgi:hypothetical protein